MEESKNENFTETFFFFFGTFISKQSRELDSGKMQIIKFKVMFVSKNLNYVLIIRWKKNVLSKKKEIQ